MTKIQKKKSPDLVDDKTSACWYYSDLVKEHFFHPRNFLKKDPKPGEFDAEGQVGNFKCGDIMRMWLKVEPKTEKIQKLKWRTFGCGPAIASTSAFTEMVLENHLTIKEALKIKPQDVVKKLGGVPSRKIHCSVMADLAFKKAVENYYKKTKK
ncbi:MAG: Nitrogen-fixing NifU domain protein [Parcubacteria group bacterium GW2011_GWB1_41_6]|nr:MAG: Nitrogen-fixing NifU domain protein [Parcubacteria group bacterium GW2011_GWB1_41_6]